MKTVAGWIVFFILGMIFAVTVWDSDEIPVDSATENPQSAKTDFVSPDTQPKTVTPTLKRKIAYKPKGEKLKNIPEEWNREVPKPVMAMLQKAHERVKELEKENDELRRNLNWSEEEKIQNQGEPIPPPQNLAPRFSQESLMSSLKQGFEEADMKGSITDIDCSEHPCLLAGVIEGEVGPETFNKILETRGMNGYRDDHRFVTMSSSVTRDENGNEVPQGIFCVGFYPPDDDHGKDIRKRNHFRQQQLMEAMSAR